MRLCKTHLQHFFNIKMLGVVSCYRPFIRFKHLSRVQQNGLGQLAFHLFLAWFLQEIPQPPPKLIYLHQAPAVFLHILLHRRIIYTHHFI